jgi:outer membrane biosynthesis protein TonB
METLSRNEKKGIRFSALLHGLLLLFLIFGLPELWESHREKLPTAMTVEIVPITEISNIQAQPEVQKPKEQPKKEPPKPTPPKPKVKQEKAPEKKPEPKPVPSPKKEEKKEEKPKEEVKKEEPKKDETKKDELDLDAILKGIAEENTDESQEESKNDAPQESKKAVSDNYNPSLPMGLSEIDMIRQQFMKCWNVPAGARDAHSLIVVIDVEVAQDGSVLSAKLGRDEGRYYSDPFFRAAADSALRAVRRCSPLKNLPANKFDTWKQMEITFDPRDMLY